MARYLRTRNCPICGKPVYRTHHCQGRPQPLVKMSDDFRTQVRQQHQPEPEPLPLEGLEP